ncbi:MAG: carbamoyltransferase HypF [Lachnospiraceae bacterium]|nr:carbamoyltransferase HypF [Lachnospiraceae bacterium]
MMEYHQIEITIYGLVQGVGFRPFVAEQSEKLDLTGTVRNIGGIVRISASGKKEALDEFVHRLSACPPEGARVDRVEVTEASEEIHFEEKLSEGVPKEVLRRETSVLEKKSGGQAEFIIVESESGEDSLRFLPQDIATCDFCTEELFNPKNRRYRYPFISCTACGPRFSIMENVPYDRDTITMRNFKMCPECRREYQERGNKRRHAQTIACAECGPEVKLYPFAIVEEFPFKDEVFKDENLFHGGDALEGQKEKTGRPSGKEMHAWGLTGDTANTPIAKSIQMLKEGKILAIKDIGGFHFAFDPKNREPARRLRHFKRRERKAFAVMFPSVSDIERYCEVSETEKRLLCSDARPIVLLKKRPGMDFVPEVCGESRYIGAMLPCNPLQILILKETGPLVMTSGNRGGEPIITDEKEMFAFWEGRAAKDDSSFFEARAGKTEDRFMENQEWEKDFRNEMKPVPDAILTHNRKIVYGLDDSIYQVTMCGNREMIQIIRRARGLVPEPVELPVHLSCDTFAAGGDLKAVYALGRENMAYLSGHFGDLEDVHAAESREKALEGMCELFGISPVHAVCDMHPGYISARHVKEELNFAAIPMTVHQKRTLKCSREKNEIEREQKTSFEKNYKEQDIFQIRKVQHHHAHIAAVMAEYALEGKVLGVAFDGTGYGADGTVWGGEFLLCEGKEFVRVGHLEGVFLTGGDASAKNALVTAYAYLCAAVKKGYMTEEERSLFLPEFSEEKKLLLNGALENKINTVESSSIGRLFDAAAAVLGICRENSYEGECPERLQAYAEKYLEEAYSTTPDLYERKEENSLENFLENREAGVDFFIYQEQDMWMMDGVYLISSLAKKRSEGVPVAKLAFEFHRSLAGMTVRMCEKIYKKIGCVRKQIALGGGTMYNRLFLKLLVPALEEKGYEVYINEKVPSGDGGLAYGQMALEAWWD